MGSEKDKYWYAKNNSFSVENSSIPIDHENIGDGWCACVDVVKMCGNSNEYRKNGKK